MNGYPYSSSFPMSFAGQGMQSMQGGAMPAMPSQQFAGTLPAVAPTGPAITVPAPVQGGAITPAPGEMVPQTLQTPLFNPGFLRTQIGRRVRVEFLIGTGTLVDRSGTLIGVGASYILIRPLLTDDVMMCDLYSIKFVTILR